MPAWRCSTSIGAVAARAPTSAPTSTSTTTPRSRRGATPRPRSSVLAADPRVDGDAARRGRLRARRRVRRARRMARPARAGARDPHRLPPQRTGGSANCWSAATSTSCTSPPPATPSPPMPCASCTDARRTRFVADDRVSRFGDRLPVVRAGPGTRTADRGVARRGVAVSAVVRGRRSTAADGWPIRALLRVPDAG